MFLKNTRTKKQLFLALISANGVHNTYYAENLFTGFATLDDLFKL